MPSTSPGNPTLNGQQVTLHHLMNAPLVIQRRLNELVHRRMVGGRLLTGRVDATGSGSAIFQASQPIFANDNAQRLTELSEYPLTDDSEAAPSIVSTDKWGLAGIISDEAIARNRLDAFNQKMSRLANTVVWGFDSIALSAIATTVLESTDAAAVWGTASADPLLDVMLAKAAIDEEDAGYEADTIVATPTKWAQLVAATKVLEASPREAADSNVLSGNMIRFAGLNILKTNHLPGGKEVMVLDSQALGSVVWEDRGGRGGPAGWMGDPSSVAGCETRVFRPEGIDGYRIEVRKVQVPWVQEPSAARFIDGVSA
ncbi:hypothetical protein [Nocardioides sp. REDSEA-S30_B4]|jgi:hypothetical protein|uniref:phage major capsid protein n=1 Tax=Nocardioides sp. REDSEA-S30_B4 TaxID=1811552 RepID=UPI000A7A90BB|nr:hypothetical protein [Nocardioides sp. REDSEA-S30_B4]